MASRRSGGEEPSSATSVIVVPSKRNTRLYKASHNREALAAMVVNTGCRSVGELAPEDLRGGRLLLERLGDLRMGCRERPILLLQLREQADVLDRDDRLIGEGRHQIDLPGRERLWLRFSGRR